MRQRYRTKRGKERYRYVALVSCSFCGDDFVPTRKGVHKYCSSSCRSRACKERNPQQYSTALQQTSSALPAEAKAEIEPITEAEILEVQAPPKESFSLTRTAESAAGAGAVSVLQYFALESMIDKKLEGLKQEIIRSRQITIQQIIRIIDNRLKPFATPPRKAAGIDAQEMINAMRDFQ